MNIILISTILFIFIGILEILLSIPLIFMKIKPNNYFGFRTKQTVADTTIWYKVNKRFGLLLIGSGVVLIIGMMFSMLYPLTIMDALLIGLIILFTTLLISLIYGLIYSRTIS